MTSKKESGTIDISVVIPVYRGETTIEPLTSKLHTELQRITQHYEIILVDDRSPDTSWQQMQELSAQDERVISLRLSKNFGQHYTIMAGLARTSGHWIVVMDCDLQDQPEEIAKLWEARNGVETVLALRENRQDSPRKRANSWLFYKIFNYLTDTNLDSRVANFGLYHRKVITAVLEMGDAIKYFPAMINWVGFERRYVEVAHRAAGERKSAYSLMKLLSLAGDTIVAFSDKPLRYSTKLGFGMSCISAVIAISYFIRYLTGGIEVPGYTSLILSIWFIGGLLLFCLGIIGTYIGKLFRQVKNRPIYIIDYERCATPHTDSLTSPPA